MAGRAWVGQGKVDMKSAVPTKAEKRRKSKDIIKIEDVEIMGHTKVSWAFAMLAAAEDLLREEGQFTSEILVKRAGPPPNHPSEVGAVTAGIAKKLGLKSLGTAKNNNKQSHGGKLTIWGK